MLLLRCRSSRELSRAWIEALSIHRRAVGQRPRGTHAVGRLRDLLDIVILTAAQQRGASRHQAREDRERERLVQPVAKRRRDQLWEERAPDERRVIGG